MAHIKFNRSNIIRQHYTSALRSAYLGHEIFDPDYATQRDVEIWDKLRRDGKILSLIERRLFGVAAAEPICEAASDRPEDKMVAAAMDDLIKKIKKFPTARKLLAKSVFRGDAWAAISGRRDNLALSTDVAPRNWWVPRKLVDVDRNRFRQVVDEEYRQTHGGIRTKWQIYKFKQEQQTDDWEDLGERRQWFVRVVFDESEESLGYGLGLQGGMYYYARAKAVALADGVDGLKRWAQGLLKVKVGSSQIGDENSTTSDIQDAWINVLKKHLAEHILVYFEDDEVDVVQWDGKGHEIVMDLVNYFDNCLSQLVLMSVLPTGGGDQAEGSFARAKVEEGQQDSVINFDQKTMYEDITNDLLTLLWKTNIAQFREMLVDAGLSPVASMPSLVPSNVEIFDPVEQMQIIEGASRIGLPLKKEEVYQRIGFTMPADDDEIFVGEQPQQPGAFGGMFSREEEPPIIVNPRLNGSDGQFKFIGDSIKAANGKSTSPPGA